MWVWRKLKLTRKGDLSVVSVRAFVFVDFFTYSAKRYPEWANIVTLHPKHPKWDQNLQFTRQSETTSIPVTFIWEFPPEDCVCRGIRNLKEWKGNRSRRIEVGTDIILGTLV